MSYSSAINLHLGEIPKTQDPNFFADAVDIYNALHILAQYVNYLKRKDEHEDPSEALWVQFPFRGFYAIAGQNLAAGRFVGFGTFLSGDAYTDGRAYYHYPDNVGTVKRAGNFITLNSASAGQKVHLGQMPGILHLNGLSMGDFVKVTDDGVLYRDSDGSGNSVIGLAVGTNAALLIGSDMQFDNVIFP